MTDSAPPPPSKYGLTLSQAHEIATNVVQAFESIYPTLLTADQRCYPTALISREANGIPIPHTDRFYAASDIARHIVEW